MSQSNSSYTSLHQIAKASRTVAYGFKNQFRPSNANSDGGFGYGIENTWFGNPLYRFYIPEGTTFFGFCGYLPQAERYATIAQMGKPSARGSMLSDSEYQGQIPKQGEEERFARLLAGEEVISVHNGGGQLCPVGALRSYNRPLTKGGWVYVRVLNGSNLFSPRASFEVDLGKYVPAYNALTFDGSGDPVQNEGGPGTDPDDGGNPGDGTTMTGLLLSRAKWDTRDTNTSVFSIQPEPSFAELPQCTFGGDAHPGLMFYASAPSASNAFVGIDIAKARQLPAGDTTIQITCGSHTKPFVITNPAASSNERATASAREVSDIRGNVTLMLKVQKPASEISNASRMNYWVGAVMPGQMFSLSDPQMFLLAARAIGGYQWQHFTGQDVKTGAFVLNKSTAYTTDELVIPLGFSKKDLAAANATVHFAYQFGDGEIKVMDYTWKP